MAKASFIYRIQNVSGRPFIIIEDTKESAVSVTRDIVTVVDEICTENRINPVEHFIIYKDRRGNWDGYNFSLGQFVELRNKNWLVAAERMINK